ncbi:peptide/nickel transport system permease protein [Lampropedia hyalina DSM 16112]|uniref:Peptide/nickel transport system permease protein n=1 Tax=Lampropedia hyalina DSM 16112 TaxID=1122156 RepID=A0A1M4SIM9_9BURK|nr:ABC transporter permease [Lampropedia hyalina]SHE32002.1 peptide/nickel transport system permease protein [Lampropedia hyalina DSM 16112]
MNTSLPSHSQAATRVPAASRHGAFWQRSRAFLGLLLRNPAAWVGLVILAFILLLATVGHWVFPGDPWDMVAAPMLWPGEDASHPLGSDSMGRDLATGLVSGASVSLLVGLVSTLISTIVGIGVGMLAGYFRGRTDAILLRVIEVFQTVPNFVLAVVLVAVFRPSVATVVWSIGIVSWPPTARLVRSEFLQLREREFVQAARATGMGHWRIIFREILPNALPPVVVVATLSIAYAIQTEAALAFLGLGDPNVMSWGTIIGSGREQVVDAWYICGLPGILIVLTVLAFNLLGEGINDAFNPYLRQK